MWNIYCSTPFKHYLCQMQCKLDDLFSSETPVYIQSLQIEEYMKEYMFVFIKLYVQVNINNCTE